MADLWMDVDAALGEVPVNLMPLIDDTDFKTREESVVCNQAGLDLLWNFIAPVGAFMQAAVTPTDMGGGGGGEPAKGSSAFYRLIYQHQGRKK